MKTCTQCRKVKPDSEFRLRKQGKHGLDSVCKACIRTYERDRRHTPSGKAGFVAIMAKTRAKKKQWIDSLKLGKVCADCGHAFHPCAMDWDHVRGVKCGNIAKAHLLGWSNERILAEIDKCELVCSNCHRVRTLERRIAKNNLNTGLCAVPETGIEEVRACSAR